MKRLTLLSAAFAGRMPAFPTYPKEKPAGDKDKPAGDKTGLAGD
jgi:hypothetical protein